MNRKAFTLIELLVVIAIIAILAAILFPVFAQAKVAAKKTASLSGVKQLNLGAIMYAGDFDDLYPLQQGRTDADGWLNHKYVRTPANWQSGQSAAFVAANEVAWANSMQIYLKSRELLHAPGENVKARSGYDYASALAKPEWANLQYNGTLTEYPATGIASPSKLITFWQGWGARSYRGVAVPNPVLWCDNPDQACRYVPTKADCDISRNGEWSTFNSDSVDDVGFDIPQSSVWMYGMGANAAMADGSAKFRRMGGNVNGKTDYRTDPYSSYNSQGIPAAGWNDDYWCHTLIFRPDFDFENFGTPYEG